MALTPARSHEIKSAFLVMNCAMKMQKSVFFVFVICVLPAWLNPDVAASSNRPATAPVNVIFDTDACWDNDDGMALAIVHALHDRHEANLVAVTLSIDEQWCAPYVDVINMFYNHPDIPIGAIRSGLGLDAAQEKSRTARSAKKPQHPTYTFADLILKQKNPDGLPIYPRRLMDGSQAPEAVSLLRKVLVAQPDGSVVMIQVGNSATFAALLDSQPDVLSDLSGYDLVMKKVRLLSVMAGTFQDVKESNKTVVAKGTGFNIYEDVPSAQNIFTKWPTPIVVSGAEIGLGVEFPGISVTHDFSYVSHHPIAESYRYICTEVLQPNGLKEKCPHDHHTADLTATLYALRPDRNYFSLSKPGRVTVLPDGNVRFDEAPEGKHYHLNMNEEQKVRAQEAMVMLVSQPPVNAALLRQAP